MDCKEITLYDVVNELVNASLYRTEEFEFKSKLPISVLTKDAYIENIEKFEANKNRLDVDLEKYIDALVGIHSNLDVKKIAKTLYVNEVNVKHAIQRLLEKETKIHTYAKLTNVLGDCKAFFCESNLWHYSHESFITIKHGGKLEKDIEDDATLVKMEGRYAIYESMTFYYYYLVNFDNKMSYIEELGESPMEVGSIVRPKPESKVVLRSGSSSYQCATVKSVSPFVIHTTDMTWHQMKAEDFEVIGKKV